MGLGDGWASAEPRSRWQPLGAPALLARLADWAAPLSRLFGPPDAEALAFPWAFTPWVLVLRSRPGLAARREEGWDLLLDPSLKGRLVLPSSPRICMALMGRDFERIQALRRQALAYDDRDGLNLLLSGGADAAVLPLRRVIPLLRRDQRLAVVLPASGAPLAWQVLLRPAGSGAPRRSLGWRRPWSRPCWVRCCRRAGCRPCPAPRWNPSWSASRRPWRRCCCRRPRCWPTAGACRRSAAPSGWRCRRCGMPAACPD